MSFISSPVVEYSSNVLRQQGKLFSITIFQRVELLKLSVETFQFLMKVFFIHVCYRFMSVAILAVVPF